MPKNGRHRLAGKMGGLITNARTADAAKIGNKIPPKSLTGNPARLMKKTGRIVTATPIAGEISTPCIKRNLGGKIEMVANPINPQKAKSANAKRNAFIKNCSTYRYF